MNWILIALGLNIIVVTLIYIFLRKRIDRAMRSNELLAQIELEVDKIVTELNLTTDRNITLIEDRIETLNALIDMSDKKIVLLNREVEKKNQEAPMVYSKPRPVEYKSASNSETPVENLSIPPEDTEEKEAEDNQPVKVDFSTNQTHAALSPPKTSKQKVLDMYTQGVDVHIIASKLNITLGEIELILSMNQRAFPEK